MPSHFVEIKANNMSIGKRKLVSGVGVNDAKYKIQIIIEGKILWCPYYRVWSNMINRCYNDNSNEINSIYFGCIVSKEWLTFSIFKLWMKTQDWKNKSLDKDIIEPGNKTYSSKNCVFVHESINNLLCDSKANRGKYPQGVYFHKNRKKFVSRCKVNGKIKHLGYFDNQEDAEFVYIEFKSNLIVEIANKQKDDRVKNGLILHSKLLGE